MNNQLHAQIEDYLAGTLEGEARAQFEKALQTDPSLAEELALYREMADALRPGPEDALRANLQLLGEQYTPAKKNTRLWWMSGILLLAGMLGWWMLHTPTKTTPEQTPLQTPIEKNAPPMADNPAAMPPEKQAEPANTQQSIDQKSNKNPALIAADFTPNPRLEALMGSQYRGDDNQLRLVHPTEHATLTLKDGQANFVLSGDLKTDENQLNTPLRVLIFSNKPAEYEAFHFVFQKKITLEKQGDVFHFQVTQPLRIAPGLYYFLIEDPDSGKLFHVGKWTVTPPK